MITLTGGNIQDGKGNLLNGFLTLQLTQDATVIATPGLVVRAIQITFQFANGNLVGTCKCYSNAELTPGTQYQVSFADGNRSRLGDPTLWQFAQAAGSTVDIGTMVSTAQGISYPAPVLQNPSGQQNINGQTLNMEGASVGFSAAASTTADSFFSRISAGIIAVGTAIGNALGTLNAASVAVTTAFTVKKPDGTLPATIANDTAGGILATNNAGKTLQFGNGGTLFLGSSGNRGQGLGLFGATSGDAILSLAATGGGGGVITIPNVTDTLVGKATTDTLTNKTLNAASSGNAVSLLNAQFILGAVTGNGTDQTLYTFNIPANTIGAGKGIRIIFNVLINAAATTFKLSFGGSNTYNFTTNAGLENVTGEVLIFNNAGVGNAQTYLARPVIAGTSIFGTTSGTLAIATTSAVTISLTGNCAAANTMTPQMWVVESIQ
jgi:hypothetical protein